ncbi:Uncharacterised protein [Bordetella pertussis]|nr:Uncharacterised protein [Bordetella pertussis]
MIRSLRAGAQDRPDLSTPKAWSYLPGSIRKATLTRFQALIDITRNVRSESSCSDSCSRTCAWISSDMPSAGIRVNTSVQARAARSRGLNSVDSRHAAMWCSR